MSTQYRYDPMTGQPLVSPRPMARPTDLKIPGANDSQGFFGKLGGLEGLSSIADGLASLGNIYGAIQGVKLAREQLDFSKGAYNTNLANQTQEYNTRLEDRTVSRYHTQGGSAADVSAYLAKHSMPDRTIG